MIIVTPQQNRELNAKIIETTRPYEINLNGNHKWAVEFVKS